MDLFVAQRTVRDVVVRNRQASRDKHRVDFLRRIHHLDLVLSDAWVLVEGPLHLWRIRRVDLVLRDTSSVLGCAIR